MIGVDTSSMIAWLQGDTGADVALLREALANAELGLPPPTAAELLSWPTNTPRLKAILASLHDIPITDGFWERVGDSRRTLRAKAFKANLANALIAQCCIDADVPLIARDADFRHFATHCGLKLAAPLP